MRFISRHLLPVCFFVAIQVAAGADVHKTMKGWYAPKGSAPPGYAVFPCIDDLNGKEYSAAAVQNCLKNIFAKPYVRRAWVVEPGGDVPGESLIVFHVQTKKLKVEQLAFEMDTGEESELREWLKRNVVTLQVGRPFSTGAESSTWEGIRQFYRNKGILVEATPTVILDYNTGKANVNFKITRGPEIPKEGAYPPYGKPCADVIMGINESQVDDYVPLQYVTSKIKLISGYVCYTPEAAQRDVDTLNALPFLDGVSVAYTGEPGSRQVSYMLKGKPLIVSTIKVEGYGASAPCLGTAKRKINISVGDIYRRSVVDQATRDLEERLCPQPGYWTEVREQDIPTGDNQIDVVFTILVDPLQTIIINGTRIN
jgi:outer membrane protein assembly factor BamA